jgi:hypothetical protein
MRKKGMREAGDERIFGSCDFVSALLEQAEEGVEKQFTGGERLAKVKQDFEDVCRTAEISPVIFRSGGRKG